MTVMFPVDNARTVDFNANDVGYVPSNAPHLHRKIQGTPTWSSLETLAAANFTGRIVEPVAQASPPAEC